MKRWLSNHKSAMTLGLVVMLSLIMAVLEPRFVGPSNLLNILLQISMDGMVAAGLTLVVITGGLDLSVGAVTAMSGVVFVLALPLGIWIAGFLVLMAGAIVGFVNGFLVGPGKLNSFIVTLGAMAGIQGIALWLSRGYPIAGPGGDFEMLGGGSVLYIPVPVAFYFVVLASAHFLLTQSQFGRDLYAIGGNREAARLANIPVASREWAAYVLCSALSAFSGMILASRLNTGSPIVGQDLPLQAIAAVVLGGTSLYGGRGGVIQTFFGILIIGVLSNGLNLLNVSPAYQWSIKGSMLILVAGIDSARRKGAACKSTLEENG